jgi:hypothetical protein
MTSSVKIASRVNAVVASEVQRAEDLALIAWVLVARGLRPAKGRKAADRCTSRGGGWLAIRRGLGISVENILGRRSGGSR